MKPSMLDPDKVLAQYNTAKGRMDLWMNELQVCYDLVIPNQAKFSMREMQPGAMTTQHVYDHTAPNAVVSFANNIVMNLMPPGQVWCKLEPGRKLKETEESSDVKEALEYYTNTLFDFINASNFYSAVRPSIMEMSISTGAILINEGTSKDNPFHFTSVPLHELSFGGVGGGEIKDVYRKFKIEGQYINHQWPDAEMSNDLKSNISQNPDRVLELIEGTVYKPNNEDKYKYCYFIMVEDGKEIIFQEYRSYSPWIIFRPHVFSGELLGRGPMLNMKTALQTINRMAEDELALNAFLAKPLFMFEGGAGFNPFTAKMQSGSLIPVESTGNIKQLQIEGNLQYQQLSRESVKEDILNALGVNQFTPQSSGNKTATEVAMVESNRKFHNEALASTLQNELCTQVAEKCFKILSRFGYWEAPAIDHNHIKIKFHSPVNEAQNQININKIVKYAQTLNEIVGPQMGAEVVAYGLDIHEMTDYVSKEMNLPSKVLRDALSKSNMLKAAHQQMQGQQQPPQAPPMSNQLSQQGAQNEAAGPGQLPPIAGATVRPGA